MAMDTQRFDTLFKSVGVIAQSVVTWIALAVVAIQAILSTVLADDLPGGVVEWLTRAVVILAGIAATIRRVTPVPQEERGFLP